MKREFERRNRVKLSTVLCASALALGSGLLGGPAYAQDVTADAFHAALESYRSRMLDAIWAIHSVQTEGPFCSNAEKQKAYGELLPLGRRTEELAADFDTFHTDVLRSMNYAYIAKQYYEADIHPEDRRTWADASAMKSRMLDLYKRTREELRKAKVIDCTQEETQTTETTTAGSDPTPEPGPDLPAPPPALNLASPPALPDHFCSELEQTTFLVDRINPLMIDAGDQGQAWREYAQQLEKIAQRLHGASRNAVLSKARQARSMMHRADAAARALDRARSTVIHTPVIDCATKDAEEHAGATRVASPARQPAPAAGTDELGLWQAELYVPARAIQGVPFTVTVTVSRIRSSGTYRFRYGGEGFDRTGDPDLARTVLVGEESGIDRPLPDWMTEDGWPPDPAEFMRELRVWGEVYWLLEGSLRGARNLAPRLVPAPELLRVDEKSFTIRNRFTCQRAGDPYRLSYRANIAFWYLYRDVFVERGEPWTDDEGRHEARAYPRATAEGACVAPGSDLGGQPAESEVTTGEDLDLEPAGGGAAGEPAGAGGATEEPSGAGDRKPEDEESESDQVGSLPRDWNPEDLYVGIDLGAIGETLTSSPADAGSYASATQREGVTLDVTLPAGSAGSGGGGLAGNAVEEPAALARLAASDLPPDAFSTAAFDASRVSDAPVEAYLVATGEASGDAFRLHAINRGTEPVTLRGDGLVLEPLELGKKARREFEAGLRRISEEGGTVAEVTGYCLERLKLPPTPGQLFRLAPPETQRRFSGAGAIMAAGRRLEDEGLLNPDGDPATYADAVTQWAIWVEQEGMSRQEFEDAFVEQIRENYDAAGREWADRHEEAARGLVPNRWRDVQRVLEAAEPGSLWGGERR